MANMSPKKNPIPEQDPNVRNKNFEEVALGYTVEMAVDEANRCLNCPRPACVREQDFKGAYHKILEDSSLPAICGRVCPQEKQCESKCVRGIKGEPVGIGRLERFVADWNRENADEMPEKIATNGHRVAVIGSGPSMSTSTRPAACWLTASPSSVCRRPSCRRRSTSSWPWASTSCATRPSASA